MPRSFLVKKVKLDTFSSADLESSYGRARGDLGARLQEKGGRRPRPGRPGHQLTLGGVEGQGPQERDPREADQREVEWTEMGVGERQTQGQAGAGLSPSRGCVHAREDGG